MMPELGKYTAEVLMAYGGALLLLLGIAGQSWRRFRRVRREMDRVEGGRHG